MIQSLRIERFKSIRRMDIQCRRINMFIGEPGAGKSNVIEALGLLSCLGIGGKLADFVRIEETQNFFYDNMIDEPVRIECMHAFDPDGFRKDEVLIEYDKSGQAFVLTLRSDEKPEPEGPILRSGLPAAIHGGFATSASKRMSWAKLYRYRLLEKYDSQSPEPLLPPHGSNLFSVVLGSKALRQVLKDIFSPCGLAPMLDIQRKSFAFQKKGEEEDIAIQFPMRAMSDTMLRMFFYRVAIESNENAALFFEEPEAHTFPYYTKHLGELIALEKERRADKEGREPGEKTMPNQYFIATHNPYLLEAILEKSPAGDVAVFAVRLKGCETVATLLSPEQLDRLLDGDPFLGIENILESDG